MYRDELKELALAESELEALEDELDPRDLELDPDSYAVPAELEDRLARAAERVRALHRRLGGVKLTKRYGPFKIEYRHSGQILDRRPQPKAKQQAARAPRRQSRPGASSESVSSDDGGPEPPPRAYTAAEIASSVGLSLRTVRRAIATGDLRAIRLGRAVRITDDDLRAFLSSAPRVR
jgi:excisionase family DNA binding protein